MQALLELENVSPNERYFKSLKFPISEGMVPVIIFFPKDSIVDINQ